MDTCKFMCSTKEVGRLYSSISGSEITISEYTIELDSKALRCSVILSPAVIELGIRDCTQFPRQVNFTEAHRPWRKACQGRKLSKHLHNDPAIQPMVIISSLPCRAKEIDK